MNTSSKIILASTVLAGAAATVVVVAKRKRIAEAAGDVADDIVEVAQAAKTAITNIVEAVGGSLSASTIRKAMQHNIPALVERYRGDVPFGVAMAILEHESGFDPTIYNYTGNGCTKKLCRGHWTGPGSRIGRGANGLYQIMSHLIGKGYDAPSVDSLFDPETNIRAALKARNSDLQWIVKNAGSSLPAVLLGTLIYMTHAEGLGKAQTAVEWAKVNGGLAWDVITNAPWVSSGKGKWRIYNRLSGLATVGKRSLLWEAAKPQMLSGTLQGLRVLAGLGLMTLDGGVP